MKNIFKLMGMALIAGSLMFVACNKDEEEENNNNNGGNNGGNNNTEQSYKISLAGNTWEPGVVRVYDNTADDYITFKAIFDEDDAEKVDAFATQYAVYIQYGYADEGMGAEKPYVRGFLESVVGEYDYASTKDCMILYDPTHTYTVDDTIFLTSSQGTDTITPGDYYRYNAISSSFTEKITAVDLNALTMSATWSENCFDFEQAYVVNQGQSYGDLIPLEGVLNNYKWTWYSAK